MHHIVYIQSLCCINWKFWMKTTNLCNWNTKGRMKSIWLKHKEPWKFYFSVVILYVDSGRRNWSCFIICLLLEPGPIILELWFKTFWWHLSIEPFKILAVVIDHVVVSYPLHLTLFCITQLTVCWWCPPVSRSNWSTFTDTDWSIPLASPCPKSAVSCYERRTIPINLNQPPSSSPVISIP